MIGMYDPSIDAHPKWKDRPCNTHIYLRIVSGHLDMTVCNRSNDAVWGMTGANAVHMTYLQEMIACGIGKPVGRYYVMTNNLHIYEHHWPSLASPQTYDYYRENIGVTPYPLMVGELEVSELMEECERFVGYGAAGDYTSGWINDVVVPMYEHYMCRLNGDKDTYDLMETKATDWRLAEKLWRRWHK